MSGALTRRLAFGYSQLRRPLARPSSCAIAAHYKGTSDRICSHSYATTPSPEESALAEKVRSAIPDAVSIEVTDESGGCGASYNIHVVSESFRGLNRLKQHRMVSGPLKEDMKTIHALRIFTEVPDE